MLTSVIAVVKNVLVRRAHSVECVAKRLIEPARSMATITAFVACDSMRSRRSLLADNALLRQQVIVLRRSVKRPALSRTDRVTMVLLAGFNRNWRDTLHLVQPDTLLRWHREISKIVWRRKSRPKGQPKRLAQEAIDLIKEMAVSNVTWGAKRIRGELLELGIRVSKRTILGEEHFQSVLREYVGAYFNVARPHQGIEQQIPCAIGTTTEQPDRKWHEGVLSSGAMGHIVCIRSSIGHFIQHGPRLSIPDDIVRPE